MGQSGQINFDTDSGQVVKIVGSDGGINIHTDNVFALWESDSSVNRIGGTLNDGNWYATSFTENGTALSSKYLGISAKAADANLLDGQDSTYYRTTSSLYHPDYQTGTINTVAKPLFDITRADRLAFLPAEQIIIETSTDAGATWVDAGISDTDKRKLFTGQRPSSIRLPLKGGVKSTDCLMRITITGMRYDETGATGGMYNARHYWFGIKGVFGIRYSVEW